MWKLTVAALVVSLAASVSVAQDREGYYYPEVTSEEIFKRTMLDVPPGGREERVRFVINATKALREAPGNPRFVLFEKGGDAQHLIIVALDDEIFRTLYRARAVLAQFTGNIRGSEFFDRTGIATEATFFDLIKLLGFEDVVVSDGKEWAHRVIFQ